VELRRYIAVFLRWWWLIAVSGLLAAGVSYTVSNRQHPVYEATTTLIVGSSMQSSDLTSSDIMTSERLARTYADLARREPVLQEVVAALSLQDTWQNLRKEVDARPIADTQLLAITAEAGSPEDAQITADEVARRLIRLSPGALQDQERRAMQRTAAERMDRLKAKIDAGELRLAELEAAMDGPLSAEQVRDLQGEIDTLEGLIINWENNLTDMMVFVDSKRSPNYLAVVEPAQANPNPIRPKVAVNTLLAGVVGALLALGVAFLIEYLDDTLKSPDDLRQSLGLPALAAIGHIQGKSYHDKLLTRKDPFAPESEAYRRLRSNIQFMSVDRPLKAIVVTSATSGEGKSMTTANLGIVMAQAGLKTILVDADLRRPSLDRIFRVSNIRGMTDLLRAPELDVNSHLKETGVENLRLLPGGMVPPNPSELLGSKRMEQLLDKLSKQADVVIVDSPPVLAVTDAAVLAKHVSGLVLVTKAGQTRRDAALQALEHLRQAGANLLGGVLNHASPKTAGYHQYYSVRYNGGGHDTSQPTVASGKRPWWRGLLGQISNIK
jgi:succinoglycan biosynthesis transport protein ExoP